MRPSKQYLFYLQIINVCTNGEKRNIRGIIVHRFLCNTGIVPNIKTLRILAEADYSRSTAIDFGNYYATI